MAAPQASAAGGRAGAGWDAAAAVGFFVFKGVSPGAAFGFRRRGFVRGGADDGMTEFSSP